MKSSTKSADTGDRSSNSNHPALKVVGLGHVYHAKGRDVKVFDDLNLTIQPGELVAVHGASGSGKTTLLLACGAMQPPTTGIVSVENQDVYSIPARSRVQLRARRIGYLFQTLELVPYLSLVDNVRMAHAVSRETARQWLGELGLSDRMAHRPADLSQGQRQRAALARAVAHQPKLLLADEPTGNLDEHNSTRVFETLRAFANDGGAVLVATHDHNVVKFADSLLTLEHGSLTQ